MDPVVKQLFSKLLLVDLHYIIIIITIIIMNYDPFPQQKPNGSNLLMFSINRFLVK